MVGKTDALLGCTIENASPESTSASGAKPRDATDVDGSLGGKAPSRSLAVRQRTPRSPHATLDF